MPRSGVGDVIEDLDHREYQDGERSHGKFFLNKSPIYPMNVQRPAG
jgi:hypothetical protein